MRKSVIKTVTETGLALAYNYDLDCDGVDGVCAQVTYTDATPAAKTFEDADVDVDEDTLTITAHGFFNGLKVAATTAGVLPAGTSATDYWVIVVDEDTIQLAADLADATAGTPVDITAAAGGGTHTLTPAALGGVVVKLQTSNDGTNFADLGTYTVTITAAGTKMWDVGSTNYKYLRVNHAPSAGAINLTLIFNGENQS